MRATFFQKPYEYKLDIIGEQWHQGDIVKGKLEIKTHDYMAQSNVAELGVFLCLVDLKKFKDKNDKAVVIVAQKEFQELGQVDFSFKLDANCPISEKSTGLCLLVGNRKDIFNCGVMQLKVVPQKLFLDFLEIYETFYRFKVKSMKSKKAELEVILTPPASKEFGHITKYTVCLSLIEKNLRLSITTVSNKLSMENFQTTTKEDTQIFEKEISPKEYISFGDSVNKEFFIKFLKELTESIKLKPLF